MPQTITDEVQFDFRARVEGVLDESIRITDVDTPEVFMATVLAFYKFIVEELQKRKEKNLT